MISDSLKQFSLTIHLIFMIVTDVYNFSKPNLDANQLLSTKPGCAAQTNSLQRRKVVNVVTL